MDALYFRVSSDRQTTEQFDELLSLAQKDGSERDWSRIPADLSRSVIAEAKLTRRGSQRTLYRLDSAIAERLAKERIYVEQGRSGKRGAQKRPLFERMKRMLRNGSLRGSWSGRFRVSAGTCARSSPRCTSWPTWA